MSEFVSYNLLVVSAQPTGMDISRGGRERERERERERSASGEIKFTQK